MPISPCFEQVLRRLRCQKTSWLLTLSLGLGGAFPLAAAPAAAQLPTLFSSATSPPALPSRSFCRAT